MAQDSCGEGIDGKSDLFLRVNQFLRRRFWTANALLIGCCVCAPAGGLAAPRVLRVGVVEGSQPCSYREGGVWRGLAVDLWRKLHNERTFMTG